MDLNVTKAALNGIAEQFSGKSASNITHLLYEIGDDKTMYSGLKCLECEAAQKIIRKMNKKCVISGIAGLLVGAGTCYLINVICNKDKSQVSKTVVTVPNTEKGVLVTNNEAAFSDKNGSSKQPDSIQASENEEKDVI